MGVDECLTENGRKFSLKGSQLTNNLSESHSSAMPPGLGQPESSMLVTVQPALEHQLVAQKDRKERGVYPKSAILMEICG